MGNHNKRGEFVTKPKFAPWYWCLRFHNALQVWCSANTDGRTQHALLTDVHSPERVR